MAPAEGFLEIFRIEPVHVDSSMELQSDICKNACRTTTENSFVSTVFATGVRGQLSQTISSTLKFRCRLTFPPDARKRSQAAVRLLADDKQNGRFRSSARTCVWRKPLLSPLLAAIAEAVIHRCMGMWGLDWAKLISGSNHVTSIQ